jgi:hypothetical protein
MTPASYSFTFVLLQESFFEINLHRDYQTHLYPKLNDYGVNEVIKVRSLSSTYCAWLTCCVELCTAQVCTWADCQAKEYRDDCEMNSDWNSNDNFYKRTASFSRLDKILMSLWYWLDLNFELHLLTLQKLKVYPHFNMYFLIKSFISALICGSLLCHWLLNHIQIRVLRCN